MSNAIKRKLCLLIGLSLCLVSLGACGEGAPDNSASPDGSDGSVTELSYEFLESSQLEESVLESEELTEEASGAEGTELEPSEEAFDESSEEPYEESSEEDESYDPGDGEAVIVFGESISIDGTGATALEGVVTVSEGGNYLVSGKSENGALVIDTTGKVYLTFNGLELSNQNGAAVYAKDAKRVVITLAEGTENRLSDAQSYGGSFAEAKATLFANDTLELNGTGSLEVVGNCKHAIASDDDIIVDGARLTVATSASDGLHANDNISVKSGTVKVLSCAGDGFDSEGSLNVSGGTVTVNAEGEGMKCETSAVFSGGKVEIDSLGDGIRAESDDADLVPSVVISGGSIKIVSKADGIQSGGKVELRNADGGEFDGYNLYISAGGGMANAQVLTTDTESSFKGVKSATSLSVNAIKAFIDSTDDALHTDGALTVRGGELELKTASDGLQSASDLSISDGEFSIITQGVSLSPSSNTTQSYVPSYNGGGRRPGGMGGGGMGGMDGGSSVSFATSCKGIKSEGKLEISGGTFVINSSDDSLHSAGELEISGGKLTLSTSDDGAHSDSALKVSGNADITVLKSYEGLEGKTITISGGRVHITASDDGLNAASGGTGGMGGRPGMGSSENSLTISDAYVYVNASGDGLDSNGALTVNSGLVIVDGPTSGGNGSIDSDGTTTVNGGTLIAAGSSGMLELPGQSSAQNCVCLKFQSGLNSSKTVCVKDSDGNIVLCFKPAKNGSCIIFSSELLESGETYQVYTGGTASGTLTDGLYSGTVSYSGGSNAGQFKINSRVQSFNLS